MAIAFCKTFQKFTLWQNVRIKVCNGCRTKIVQKRIRPVITGIKGDEFYARSTKLRNLKELCHKNYFYLMQRKLFNHLKNWHRGNECTKCKMINEVSFLGKQRLIKLMCSKKCIKKMCFCKSANLLCNSKCHNSQTSCNKW